MLRSIGSRRRPRYGPQICAITAAILLLVSLSLLHTHLTSQNPQQRRQQQQQPFKPNLYSSTDDIDAIVANPLLQDDGAALSNNNNNNGEDDRIDELDVIEDETDKLSTEEEILRGEESDLETLVETRKKNTNHRPRPSGYYYDHVLGVTRRAFDKKATDPWEDYYSPSLFSNPQDDQTKTKVAFGSDDQPVDEDVRNKLDGIRGISDALLLKTGRKVSSPLRQGWATWFDKKGDFLRRDRMFKSNLELLNPLNNPLLQDPDGVGLTLLTKGDKLIQNALRNEIQNPFKNTGATPNVNRIEGTVRRNRVKGVERRTLDENTSSVSASDATQGVDQLGNLSLESKGQIKSELSDNKYADGRRWGYFPGLYPHLSFSDFMDEFFTKGKCTRRVFMVWNSAPWMFSVRHQRGLESLLYHHPDACVVVFSETIELDYFKDFVKDGFKVAVAMPNLDELLKNTPTEVFASVWFEWRKTKSYPVHYSELVRLAALYKYGGLYLDSDILVLKQLSSLNNSIGLEDHVPESSLNGAVMAFEKNSLFIMECLKEFYSTYDDTLLRWNGADLLTRVRCKLSRKATESGKLRDLKVEPSSMFFPIGPHNIARYFTSPVDEIERAQQDILLQRILKESYTFHLWNSLTSSFVPEPKSLVARLFDKHCIRCLDVL